MSDIATHSDSDNQKFIEEYMPVADFSVKKNIAEDKVISMIRAGVYSGRIKNGIWFVRREELNKKTIENPVSARPPSTNILLRIFRGDYGLGITFWAWGVGGGFLFANLLLIPAAGAEIEVLVAPFVLLWFSYITLVLIGVWRSDKSFGFFSLLSKLFIIVTYPTAGYVLLYIVALALAGPSSH